MKSRYTDRLKAAVAQFEEARIDTSNCLQWLVEEADIELNCLNRSIDRITDCGTRDRLEYDRGIIQEEIMLLETAHDDWRRLSAEIEHRLPQIRWNIDEVATEALTYEDFKANEAKQAEIERIILQRRRDNIRPMTHEEMECLIREDLSAYAGIFLGLPPKGPFRVVDEVVECDFDLNGKSIVVSKLPDGVWKWRGRNSLAGGSIWHLEAAAKKIPTFEALTNVRLYFGTESMSARAGELPCIQGLKAHWEQEAYAHAADLRHDNEAVWEQRLAEAEEAGRRIRIVGNPDDLQPIVFTEFGPIHPANLPAGAFGGIFTNRRVL
ncbi:hypothetical protein [Rhizobium sp. RU36D]|uniref:hypothetical protein n=1 Tax=Rhizobium sp. RU36D TaxID=1907415 RepID=UPI0009D7C5E8|nr:hypothetical protein [Rhizobium sp. RU36D]SMD16371.1 hypothetical protein SAMN05880593_12963 [Rhizobium sp. RU36D]